MRTLSSRQYYFVLTNLTNCHDPALPAMHRNTVLVFSAVECGMIPRAIIPVIVTVREAVS
jgi:hypothetical protein